eukprot:jgi/Chrzof1/550/Cz01g20040.t1
MDPSSESAEATGNISIKVKTMEPASYKLDVSASMAVTALKSELLAICNIPVDRQRLIYKGRVLRDDQRLNDVGVQSGHTIHLVERPADATPSQGTAEQPGAQPSMPQGMPGLPDLGRLVQGLLSSLGVPGGPTQVGVQIGTTTTSGPMPTPGAQQPPPEPTHLLRSIDTFLRHLEQAPTSVQPMHVTSLAPRSSEGVQAVHAVLTAAVQQVLAGVSLSPALQTMLDEASTRYNAASSTTSSTTSAATPPAAACVETGPAAAAPGAPGGQSRPISSDPALEAQLASQPYPYMPLAVAALSQLLVRTQGYVNTSLLTGLDHAVQSLNGIDTIDANNRQTVSADLRAVGGLLHGAAALMTELARASAATMVAAEGNTAALAANAAAVIDPRTGTSPAFPRLLPSAPFAVESFSLTPGAGMMASGATSTAPAAGGATAAAGSGPEAAVGVAVEGGVPMMFGPGMGLMPGGAGDGSGIPAHLAGLLSNIPGAQVVMGPTINMWQGPGGPEGAPAAAGASSGSIQIDIADPQQMQGMEQFMAAISNAMGDLPGMVSGQPGMPVPGSGSSMPAGGATGPGGQGPLPNQQQAAPQQQIGPLVAQISSTVMQGLAPLVQRVSNQVAEQLLQQRQAVASGQAQAQLQQTASLVGDAVTGVLNSVASNLSSHLSEIEQGLQQVQRDSGRTATFVNVARVVQHALAPHAQSNPIARAAHAAATAASSAAVAAQAAAAAAAQATAQANASSTADTGAATAAPATTNATTATMPQPAPATPFVAEEPGSDAAAATAPGEVGASGSQQPRGLGSALKPSLPAKRKAPSSSSSGGAATATAATAAGGSRPGALSLPALRLGHDTGPRSSRSSVDGDSMSAAEAERRRSLTRTPTPGTLRLSEAGSTPRGGMSAVQELPDETATAADTATTTTMSQAPGGAARSSARATAGGGQQPPPDLSALMQMMGTLLGGAGGGAGGSTGSGAPTGTPSAVQSQPTTIRSASAATTTTNNPATAATVTSGMPPRPTAPGGAGGGDIGALMQAVLGGGAGGARGAGGGAGGMGGLLQVAGQIANDPNMQPLLSSMASSIFGGGGGGWRSATVVASMDALNMELPPDVAAEWKRIIEADEAVQDHMTPQPELSDVYLAGTPGRSQGLLSQIIRGPDTAPQ